MATDRRNSFAAIPQLEAQLEKILKENVIFEKKVINIQEFQSDFYSEYGQYKELISGKFSAVTADIVYLKTFEADIENLYAEAVMTKELSAEVAKLGYATIEELNAQIANISDLTTENFKAVNAEISQMLKANELAANVAELGYLKTDELNAKIASLGYITAESAELEYVKIDKANIDSAWVENLLVTGNFLIDTVHGESGYYTKDLVGVNVAGDIIVGNTIKADALILQGTDGIYRRLNIDSLGEAYVDSNPIYNQKLDGSVLVAESVTAKEINVSDLFAQDITATGEITGAKLLSAYIESTSGKIGGFTIGNSALYNGATTLAGADNSVYLGLDGISCGTKFKVDKKGVLSTADIKMEKTNTEDGITSTFGTYISSPDTWTGSGFAVPEIKTKTKTVVDGVTYSDTLTMYPFRISLEKYVTGTDNTWLRLEPTKLSMFSYITTNGFKVPELFIQPAGANSLSSVTLGKEAHQIYSVKWTDDPYDYPDDPLASCPHEMYPIDINASTVTFNSAVAIKNQGLELYHATPYIDFHFGNSDADYTSRIIESKSGTLQAECNLNITGDVGAANLTRKSVTISGLPSDAGYTCYYYPVLKVCFLRLYYTGKAISATTATVLGTVASGYRPSTQHALSIYPSQDTLKHRQAAISSDGGIKFYSEVAKDAADDTYITGFWFV